MTLICILTGLALEYFLGTLDHIRNFTWFDRYYRWLEMKCSRHAFWDGAGGVLLTLALPLSVLILTGHGLERINSGLLFLLSIAVFIYSLGPDLNGLVNDYQQALDRNNEDEIRGFEARLEMELPTKDSTEGKLISSILLRAHEQLFGVLFWFIVLGMAGALLYCLVLRMQGKVAELRGGFADAVRDLHAILMWPSSRVLALGFALSGSLVDALEGWRNVQGDPLSCSDQLVIACGLGALQYQSDEFPGEPEEARMKYAAWIGETQALINRTLIVWLTALGIMTIGGYLA